MAKLLYAREFDSTLEAAGDTIRSALRALIDAGWVKPGEEFYARLCLEEALVNAVEHGNKCNDNLKVRVEIHETGDWCRIRVYDQGPGYCPEEIRLPEAKQEHGRGVCLMRHCMEEVKYDKARRCLEMKMRRNSLCREEVR